MTGKARRLALALVGCLVQGCEPETNIYVCGYRGYSRTSEAIVQACDARLATSGLSARDRAAALYERGRARLYPSSPDLDRALSDIDLAMRLDPGRIEPYLERARFYIQSGDRTRAAADYDHVVRIDPARVDSYLERATFHIKGNDYDRAIADYDQAIRLKPWGPTYVDRAKVWFTKGDHARAFADFDTGIRLNPKIGWSFIRRGDAFVATEQLDRAIADYKEAIRLGWYPHSDLCLTLGLADRADEAKTPCSHNMGDYLAGRGIAHLKVGRLDDAIAGFNAALELGAQQDRGGAGNGLALYGRGLALQRKGDHVKAKADTVEAAKQWRRYAAEDVAQRMARYGVSP